MIFANRREAGARLAKRLLEFKDSNPVILALVRGGVPVAFEVAQALSAPLDIILVRKIGAPSQLELAIGAVADGPKPEIVTNDELIENIRIPANYIAEVVKRELGEIDRRRRLYLRGRARAEVEGKTAIVIDDGIATGATTRAALRSVRRQKPKHLVLAVPVAPASSLEALASEADEIVCLSTPEPFGAIGYFYQDFHQVEDEEVVALLGRSKATIDKTAASPR